LFGVGSDGTAYLVGIHIRGATWEGCVPEDYSKGNIGITLKPEIIEHAQREGARVRGGVDQ